MNKHATEVQARLMLKEKGNFIRLTNGGMEKLRHDYFLQKNIPE